MGCVGKRYIFVQFVDFLVSFVTASALLEVPCCKCLSQLITTIVDERFGVSLPETVIIINFNYNSVD